MRDHPAAAELGRLVELVERNVTSADEALDQRQTGPDLATALPESLDADEYQLRRELGLRDEFAA